MTIGDVVGVCTIDRDSLAVSVASATATPEPSNPTILYRNYTTDAVYPAWKITWGEMDRSTLTPEPPFLVSRPLRSLFETRIFNRAQTNDMRIPIWTPGMFIEPGRYDNNGYGSHITPYNKWPVIIVFGIFLPLIVLALLGACCLCFRNRQKRIRKEGLKDWERWAENDARLSDVDEPTGVRSGRGRGRRERRDRRAPDAPPPYSRHAEPCHIGGLELQNLGSDQTSR